MYSDEAGGLKQKNHLSNDSSRTLALVSCFLAISSIFLSTAVFLVPRVEKGTCDVETVKDIVIQVLQERFEAEGSFRLKRDVQSQTEQENEIFEDQDNVQPTESDVEGDSKTDQNSFLLKPVSSISHVPNSSRGSTGPRGPPGLPGPRGLPGPSGSHGTPGTHGSPGPQGPRGFPGPPGKNCTTCTNGHPGLNGMPGSPGLPGPMGDRGRDGFPGAPGPQGYSGPVGMKGAKGDKGSLGTPGKPGQAGPIGPPGAPPNYWKLGADGQYLIPPSFADTNRNVTVKLGDNVRLKCLSSGKPDPKIVWRRNDMSAIHQNNWQDVVVEGIELTLPNITSKDAGVYVCTASNGIGPSANNGDGYSVKQTFYIDIERSSGTTGNNTRTSTTVLPPRN